jgi:hypothetical protein
VYHFRDVRQGMLVRSLVSPSCCPFPGDGAPLALGPGARISSDSPAREAVFAALRAYAYQRASIPRVNHRRDAGRHASKRNTGALEGKAVRSGPGQLRTGSLAVIEKVTWV